jgi:hypothetical protein
MNWRIFRLPGSREWWHIDFGCGTPIINVQQWETHVKARNKDVGGNNVPRQWVEIIGADLHIVNGVAVFDYPGVIDAVREALDTAGVCVMEQT